MERTKGDGRVTWKKTEGRAVLTIKGKKKIIKPGQVFKALETEIPLSFRDTIIPMETLPEEKIEKAVVLEYIIKHKGGGRWIVEDSEGKQQNEDYLTKEEALELKEQLEK